MKILVVGWGKDATVIGIKMTDAGYGYEQVATELFATRILKKREIDLVILSLDDRSTREVDLIAKRLKDASLEGPRGLAPHVFVVWNTNIGAVKGSDLLLKAVDIVLGEFSAELCISAYEEAKKEMPC